MVNLTRPWYFWGHQVSLSHWRRPEISQSNGHKKFSKLSKYVIEFQRDKKWSTYIIFDAKQFISFLCFFPPLRCQCLWENLILAGNTLISTVATPRIKDGALSFKIQTPFTWLRSVTIEIGVKLSLKSAYIYALTMDTGWCLCDYEVNSIYFSNHEVQHGTPSQFFKYVKP